MKSFWADTHDLRHDIKMKRVEVRKLFTDPKTDDATLLAKEKELNGLKHQLMDKKAEEKVAWRKILNPEQIQMLDRMHRHHFRHHHRGGRSGKGFWRHHHHRHHHGGPMGKGPQQGPAPKTGQYCPVRDYGRGDREARMKSKGIAVIVVILLAATLAVPSTSHAWGGWWVPGAFAGGVLLGATVARPWYPPAPVYVYPYPYEYPAPQVVYTPPPPPQAYYSPPAPSDAAAAPQGRGQWVDVPGQMVNNIWVPPHKAWVPSN